MNRGRLIGSRASGYLADAEKRLAHLTPRELEILKKIAEGRANKEIGELLQLSENTVKNHVKSILSKLNAKDRTHAVTEALKRGLFQLGRS